MKAMTTWRRVAIALVVWSWALSAGLATACEPSLTCDRRYDEVTFPSTHNSFAQFYRFALPNQIRSIPEQLRHGIRGLMLDVKYAYGELRLCHGECDPLSGYITLTDTLRDIRQFLDEDRNAVVTLIIEDYVSASLLATAFFEPSVGLGSYLYQHGTYVDEAQKPRWPTVGEMVEDGRRLVVFSDNRTGDPVVPATGAIQGHPWLHYEWNHASETPYSYHRLDQISPGNQDYCRAERGEANGLFVLNHFLTPGSYITADDINSLDRLLANAIGCRARRGKWPNFLVVDFESCDSQYVCNIARGHESRPDVVYAADAINEYRLSCPAILRASAAPGRTGAVVTFPTLSQSADVVASPGSGSIFPIGETTVSARSELGEACQFKARVERVCGNGHLDAGEQCDDGNPWPGDGCSATCAIEPDDDHDGTPDAGDDFCVNVGHARDFLEASHPKLTFGNVNTDTRPGDDTFSFAAELQMPPNWSFAAFDPDHIDPCVDGTCGGPGIELVAINSVPSRVLHPVLAFFWVRSGNAWIYRNPAPDTANPFTQVTITDRGGGRVKVVAKGKKASFSGVTDTTTPLHVVVVLGRFHGAAKRGECGEMRFTAAECKWNARRDDLTCRR